MDKLTPKYRLFTVRMYKLRPPLQLSADSNKKAKQIAWPFEQQL